MPLARPRTQSRTRGCARRAVWSAESAPIDWPAVSPPRPGDPETASAGPRGRARRLLAIAAALLVLGLGALAVAAWLSGDAPALPFEYEGFD